MMRMVLEIVMALAVIGCLYFVTVVLAKEKQSKDDD